jgi:Rrf2 family protein
VAEKLVLSRRGKGGGLCLARPAKAIALLDVIRAVGPAGTQLSPCLSRPAACGRSSVCRVHAELQRIQGDIDRRLAGITLAQLAQPAA